MSVLRYEGRQCDNNQSSLLLPASSLQCLEITSKDYSTIRTLFMLPLVPQCYQRYRVPSVPGHARAHTHQGATDWGKWVISWHYAQSWVQSCQWSLQKETLVLFSISYVFSSNTSQRGSGCLCHWDGIEKYNSVT